MLKRRCGAQSADADFRFQAARKRKGGSLNPGATHIAAALQHNKNSSAHELSGL